VVVLCTHQPAQLETPKIDKEGNITIVRVDSNFFSDVESITFVVFYFLVCTHHLYK
jgi:hypothetical protein